MIRNLRTGLILGCFLVLFPLAAAACSSGHAQSTDAYIKNAEKLDKQHEAVAQPLEDKLDALVTDRAPEEKLPDGLKDTLAQLLQQEDDFAGVIEKMKAPTEAAAVQKEAVDALHAEAAYGRQVVAGITPDTTLGDLMAAMSSDESGALQERRHQACLSMQKFADDRGVAVDMTC